MDRLLRYVPHIQEATYFDIQNISDYFWSSDNEYHDLVHFNLSPPFPFFTTRYRLASQTYSKEHGTTPQPGWRQTEVLTVFQTIESVAHIERLHGPQIRRVAQDRLPTSAKWIQEAAVYFVRKRQIIGDIVYLYALNEYGQIMSNEAGETAFFIIHSTLDESEAPHLVSYLHVSGMALTFLHCRNVEILDPPPASKKRLPRKVKFESRYHRLKINAIGPGKRSQTTSRGTGITQGLHVIRGHFRSYGPEFGKGKLFGRLSGRFWVAAHLKGDEGAGVIDKDYEIE